MSNGPGARSQRVRWVVLGLLVLLAWAAVYVAVSGLSGEYGRGVVGWDALVPVALIVGFVAAVLVRQMFRGADAAPRAPAALTAGAAAAVGVLVAAGIAASVGEAAHQQRQNAIAAACQGGADTRTIEFARGAGRVIPSDGGLATGRTDGCSVTVALDKAEGRDPLDLIEQAIGGQEWQRQGPTTWVADDGFQIEARVDTSLRDEAEHAVDLLGTLP